MNQIIPEIPSLLCPRLKRLEKYKHIGGALQILSVIYTSMSGTSLDPFLQAGFLRGGDGAWERARKLWVTEGGGGLWRSRGRGKGWGGKPAPKQTGPEHVCLGPPHKSVSDFPTAAPR